MSRGVEERAMSSWNIDSNRLSSTQKTWTTPELKKLVPGTAETGPQSNIIDSTGQGDNKS